MTSWFLFMSTLFLSSDLGDVSRKVGNSQESLLNYMKEVQEEQVRLDEQKHVLLKEHVSKEMENQLCSIKTMLAAAESDRLRNNDASAKETVRYSP